MTYYLHTINGQPAYFSEPDGQIVYAAGDAWRGRLPAQPLRKTTRQIRRDQQTTIRNRLSWGMKDGAGKYGYVRVTVPD